ncbi:class I SAM-dependent methyltransferase [Clostridium sp. 'deep sea']|uniref:class I SAM-dependent methyltransferase n=1 Tax=Clostridium sp. 'deep sea' TaxID=2779445 RepID=UPI001896A4B2|nr:class I SAM-dependent methyltransferase [Clostridium sp. 'deep sea']QOR35012.1 class I SAM-dependent methyltransferase [Clostridium sp. 'deep sea']
MNTMMDYYKKLHDYKEIQLLIAALNLKVFSYMEEAITAKQIAEKLNYNSRNLALFLDALASIGLIEKSKNVYKNTAASNKMLNENSELYIGDGILFKKTMMSLDDVENKVKDGPATNLKDGAELYDFYELARVTRNEMYYGRVQEIINLLSNLYNKDDHFKLLDLGGGSGTLALEVAKHFKNSRVVVFEHEIVAKLPQQLIKEENLSKQADVMIGDFNKDDIGNNYDFIIAAGIMDFASQYLDNVTCKLNKSLNSNGYLYVITHGVSQDYLSPTQSIIGWLSGRLAGSDLLCDEKTILASILNNDFKEINMPSTKDRFNKYLFQKQ